MKKKLHIKTFGCQMNVYDSNRMKDLMIAEGYENSDTAEDSDVIIFNTCNIREKPQEKVFSEIGKLRRGIKKKVANGGKEPLIVVAGCVAQAYGEEITKRMKMVDIVVGPESYHKLPEMIKHVLEKKTKEVNIELATEEKFASLPKAFGTKGISEFITIQEGCNKFCSYCVVPYTRGREYSRPLTEIYDEALRLVDNEVKEITLLGQNVDSYKTFDDKGVQINLAKVIKKVAEIQGLERVRYMTSYPSEIDDELIEAHGNIKKLMPFIHLPAQSGSNRVLKLMNRKYTAEQYLETVGKLRKSRPDIAISSDFIVGFAGETEEDFQETLNLVKEVGFVQSFSFMYSVRQGTLGEKMDNQVDEDVKYDRLMRLQEILNKQQLEFNHKFKGSEIEVLIENADVRNKNNLFGKSKYLQSVSVEINDSGVVQENLIGKVIKVKIYKTSMKGLHGKIVF
jgi:tRNA-2-methylthio-N6-dimethylallyladenosine synthase